MSSHETEIVFRYLNGESVYKLRKDYKVSESVIHRVLSKNDIKVRGRTRKFVFDENYFSSIDSEDKAYFLGLLFADGTNTEWQHIVRIALQERDRHINEITL